MGWILAGAAASFGLGYWVGRYWVAPVWVAALLLAFGTGLWVWAEWLERRERKK